LAVFENNIKVDYDGCWMYGKREISIIRGNYLKYDKGTFLIEYGYKSHYLQFFDIDGDMTFRYTIIDDNNVISPNYIHSESMRRAVLNHRHYSYNFGAFKLDL